MEDNPLRSDEIGEDWFMAAAAVELLRQLDRGTSPSLKTHHAGLGFDESKSLLHKSKFEQS
jgi:hypothetical protein